MPKNNSKKRKDERFIKAANRQASAVVRGCGHWHTDNGAKNCTSMTWPTGADRVDASG